MEDRLFPLSSLPAWSGEALDLVGRHIAAGLPEAVKAPGNGPDPFLPGASPLRPVLLLSASRHYGCAGPRSIRMAAAVQMIHIASLLHERLGGPAPVGPAGGPDTQKVRHHRESLDILLGDFFFSRASGIIIGDGDQSIIEDMIRTSEGSAEAQAVIAGYRDGREAGPPDRCFTARADKVSLLLALALRTGAQLGVAPEEEKEALSGYGLHLGRFLRILQDVDLWLNPGPDSPADPRELRFSHPLLMLREIEGPAAWEKAASRMAGEAPQVLGEIRALLRERGCLENSAQAARSHAGLALERLQGRPGLAGLEGLREIAERGIRPPPPDRAGQERP